uniref:(northern house mosquito) hypothetical protein n=1 Tax=Culex pipiens TaxID=7175 RepID=A0A8D8AMN6_CULPI
MLDGFLLLTFCAVGIRPPVVVHPVSQILVLQFPVYQPIKHRLLLRRECSMFSVLPYSPPVPVDLLCQWDGWKLTQHMQVNTVGLRAIQKILRQSLSNIFYLL